MMTIELLTAPGCAKCAKAKNTIKSIVDQLKRKYTMAYSETDILKHPEAAMKYGIMTTPALIINGKLAFTAPPAAEELKRYLHNVAS